MGPRVSAHRRVAVGELQLGDDVLRVGVVLRLEFVPLRVVPRPLVRTAALLPKGYESFLRLLSFA